VDHAEAVVLLENVPPSPGHGSHDGPIVRVVLPLEDGPAGLGATGAQPAGRFGQRRAGRLRQFRVRQIVDQVPVEPAAVFGHRVRQIHILLELLRRIVAGIEVRGEGVGADPLLRLGRGVAGVAAAVHDFDQRLGLRPVLVVAHVDAVLVEADRAVAVDRVRSRVVGAGVEPVADDLLLALGHIDPLMPLLDELQQAAGAGADLVGREVALAVLGVGENDAVVAEQLAPRHLDVADRVERAPVAGDVEPSFFAVVVVAFQTMLVEDRLDVPQKIEDLRHAGHRLGGNGPRAHEAGQALALVGGGRFGPPLVAPDAGRALARHDGRERVHALDAMPLGVHRHKQDAAQRRQLEIRAPLLGDRHGAEQALHRERAAGRHLGHGAGIVDRLRQDLVDEQVLDRPRLDRAHLAALVDVHQRQRAVVRARVRLVGEHRLPRAGHHRPRLADPVSRLGLLLRQPAEHLGLAPAVHQLDGGLVGDQEMALAERPGVAMDVALADVLDALGVVRPQARVYQRDLAVVLAHAVARRPGRHDLRAVGHRLRGQDRAVVDLIAVEDHLPGAVGVHRPEMVIPHVKAVHVFPTHVGHLAVGEHPRRVVVLDIGRQRADIAPVRLALVERRHLRHPALHVPVGPGGAEDDPAVRQIGRLEIVPTGRRIRRVVLHAGRDVLALAGQLSQAGAVEVDLVQAVMPFPLGQVGEDEPLRVVVNLRIADVAFGVFEDRAQRPGLDVVDAESPARVHGERGPALVGRIVGDVGVPVAVDAGLAHGEEDFVGHAGLEKGREHRRLFGGAAVPRRRAARRADRQREQDGQGPGIRRAASHVRPPSRNLESS